MATEPVTLNKLIADISASDLHLKDRLIASCKAYSGFSLGPFFLCYICRGATIEQALWLKNRNYFNSLWVNEHGATALMHAALGHVSALDLMLCSGFDIHATDVYGHNALAFTVQTTFITEELNWSKLICMTMLLEAGIPVNSHNKANQTALMLSIMYGTFASQSMKILLSYGADPNMADSNGNTPLKAVDTFFDDAEKPQAMMTLIAHGAVVEKVCTQIVI